MNIENLLENKIKHYLEVDEKNTDIQKSEEPIEEKKEKKFTMSDINAAAEELKIDFSKYNKQQFIMGMQVELEHGTRYEKWNITNDDPIMTAKIVMAHLEELPNDYYTRLNKMEKEGKRKLEE